MKLADLFQRLHAAALVLAGRVALPEVPPSKLEVAMAFERTKAAVAQLQDAIGRAAAQKAADESALGAAQAQASEAQSELAAADDQIVELLQPVVDAANGLAPAPDQPPAA
jgi:hypothetical protein